MSEALLKTAIISVLAASCSAIMTAIVMPEYRWVLPLIVPALVILTLAGAALMEQLMLSEDREINEVSRILLQKIQEAEEKRHLEECLASDENG
jgi:hypothetical protein